MIGAGQPPAPPQRRDVRPGCQRPIAPGCFDRCGSVDASLSGTCFLTRAQRTASEQETERRVLESCGCTDASSAPPFLGTRSGAERETHAGK
jgi:hypothetical protein